MKEFYAYKVKGVSGCGYIINPLKKIVIKKGSEAVGNDKLTDSFTDTTTNNENISRVKYRKKLISEGKLFGNNKVLVFTEDVVFNSRSQAATIIAGNSNSGPKFFKPYKVPQKLSIPAQKVENEKTIIKTLYPDEIKSPENIIEGAKKEVIVNRFERDSKARIKCIEKRGTSCHVCDINFEKEYGEIGKDFIHIHHLKPLSEIRKEYKLNPEDDLRPVCPNCHAMLHRRIPPFTIYELREILKQNW